MQEAGFVHLSRWVSGTGTPFARKYTLHKCIMERQ